MERKINKKIGILTWHYYTNPGSSLQAFALQSLLSSKEHSVHIINYRSTRFGIYCGVRSRIKKILYKVSRVLVFLRKYISDYNIISFQEKYFNQTRIIQAEKDIESTVSDFDIIVYGSDQIWAPNVYNPIYMGAYVPSKIKKISYAASIGLNDISDDLILEYKNRLSEFYAISVREQEGMILLKQKCNIDASVVLDPTLMIDVDVYLRMQKKIKGISGSYLFCYFLNKNHSYKNVVTQYAEKHNLNIVGISDNPHDINWMRILQNVGGDQFLWLINHADIVFTDSYHGSIFSLLFHKDLWIFKRFSNDSPINQNSRIRQLVDSFGIKNRIISTDNGLIDNLPTIDYTNFETRLAILRKESLAYLKTALR